MMMVELAHHWLSAEQIRKRERCRRQSVLDAMNCGQLPYEQRGRVRYARTVDVERWELDRLRATGQQTKGVDIRADLLQFA
jgi:hypothetical protein